MVALAPNKIREQGLAPTKSDTGLIRFPVGSVFPRGQSVPSWEAAPAAECASPWEAAPAAEWLPWLQSRFASRGSLPQRVIQA